MVVLAEGIPAGVFNGRREALEDDRDDGLGHGYSDVMSACTCQVPIHGYDPERKTRCIFRCISPYCLSCVVAGDDYTPKAGHLHRSEVEISEKNSGNSE